mgnify:FL=1
MSAGEPRPDPLDRDGEWEIRATIYRNGRRVAICDTTGHESYDSAAYWIGEGLVTREVEFPRTRSGRARSTNQEDQS